MKKSLKYSHVFFITLAFLIINIIPSIIFCDEIELSLYSLPPIAAAVMVSVNGVLACIFKRKGNFLMIKKYRPSLLFLAWLPDLEFRKSAEAQFLQRLY